VRARCERTGRMLSGLVEPGRVTAVSVPIGTAHAIRYASVAPFFRSRLIHARAERGGRARVGGEKPLNAAGRLARCRSRWRVPFAGEPWCPSLGRPVPACLPQRSTRGTWRMTGSDQMA
jgi:hypothetical protein